MKRSDIHKFETVISAEPQHVLSLWAWDPALLIKGQTKSQTHALNWMQWLQWLNKTISSPKSSKVSCWLLSNFQNKFEKNFKSFLIQSRYLSNWNTPNTDKSIFPKAHFLKYPKTLEQNKNMNVLQRRWHSWVEFSISTSWERKRVKGFLKLTGILFLFSSKRYS